jgi:AcrR family transcriptional regulator
MSSPEPSDLRDRRRAFTADEIERVAVGLFAERGFADVTVDEIADAAGISPRTFFRYFPTKAHVLRTHQRRLFDRLVQALASRPEDEGPVTALREAFVATCRMRAEDRDGIVLVGRLLASAGEPTVGDIGVETDRSEELVALVAARAGVDPVTDLRPAVVTAAMTGAARAVFRAWLDSDGAVELTSVVADALDLLATGLGAFDRPAAAGSRRA